MSELTTEMVRTDHVTSAESAERFERWLAGEKAAVWDECVRSIQYDTGNPVEIIYVINPYRVPTPHDTEAGEDR